MCRFWGVEGARAAGREEALNRRHLTDEQSGGWRGFRQSSDGRTRGLQWRGWKGSEGRRPAADHLAWQPSEERAKGVFDATCYNGSGCVLVGNALRPGGVVRGAWTTKFAS